MYDLKIFDNINLDVDWFCIYYGVKNNILETNVAVDFAIRKLEQSDISNDELELTYGNHNKFEVLMILEKIIDVNREENMKIAKDKVRIAILADLKARIHHIETFLQDVENVYADFGYPPDMEKFIYYMPSNESGADCSMLDNQERMIKEFDSFIEAKIDKYKNNI